MYNFGDFDLYGTLTIGKSLTGANHYTFPLRKGDSGQFLMVVPDGSGTKLSFFDPTQPPFNFLTGSVTGALSFTSLNDTPSSFAGADGYIVSVSGNSLVFKPDLTNSLLSQVQSLSAFVENLDSTVTVIGSAVVDLSAGIDIHTSQIQAISSALDLLSSSVDTSISSLSGSIDSLSTSISGINVSISSIESTVGTLSGSLESLTSTVSTSVSSLSSSVDDIYTILSGISGQPTSTSGITSVNSNAGLNGNIQFAEGTGIEIINISAGELKIQLYTNPSVSSFNSNKGSVEVGDTILAPTLSWSFNKPLTNVSITNIGAQPSGLSGSVLDSINFPKTLNSPGSFGWNVSGIDNKGNSTSAGTSLSWFFRRYWGVSSSPSISGYNTHAALVGVLSGNELSSSRSQTKSFTASAQYLWFVMPAAFGNASFTIGGFGTTFTKENFTFTNQFGVSIHMVGYRSQFTQNGSGISVVVS
jgi:hypothetical protein